MVKILQVRLQQYMNRELPDIQAEFRKGEPVIKLPTSTGSSKKQERYRKNIYFCFIDYAKAFDCVDQNKLENSERDVNTGPPDLQEASPEASMHVQLELVLNQERSMSRMHTVTLLV